MLNMLSRLYLIRHGQTAWSLCGQHTGRTEVLLTEQGEQDVRELAERLRAVRFSRVFTSPRQRAQRTCELVGLGAVAELGPDLAEWDYGDYEGQRSADIRKGRPDWNLFQDGCPRSSSVNGCAEEAWHFHPARVAGRRLAKQYPRRRTNLWPKTRFVA